jgi:hypothetical protein
MDHDTPGHATSLLPPDSSYVKAEWGTSWLVFLATSFKALGTSM